jgi:hypothetical protein
LSNKLLDVLERLDGNSAGGSRARRGVIHSRDGNNKVSEEGSSAGGSWARQGTRGVIISRDGDNNGGHLGRIQRWTLRSGSHNPATMISRIITTGDRQRRARADSTGRRSLSRGATRATWLRVTRLMNRRRLLLTREPTGRSRGVMRREIIPLISMTKSVGVDRGGMKSSGDNVRNWMTDATWEQSKHLAKGLRRRYLSMQVSFCDKVCKTTKEQTSLRRLIAKDIMSEGKELFRVRGDWGPIRGMLTSLILISLYQHQLFEIIGQVILVLIIVGVPAVESRVAERIRTGEVPSNIGTEIQVR